MSEHVSHLEGPLQEENTYNGRMFHLSLPKTSSLNCSWLKKNIEGTSVTIEADDELDERDELYIPEVFKSAVEENIQVGTIQNLTEFHQEGINGLIGYISHNESDTVKFENQEILILDQQCTKFLIFEYNGRAFLLIISSRDSMSMLQKLLTEELSELGFVVDEITISHLEFDRIADALIDTHRMTAVEGYEEDSIHKKIVVGRNYGDAHEYKREKQQGTVHGQQFGTSQLDGSSKTMQISYDCLIRSYHKITLSMYLTMITSYIIPALSLSTQTPLTWYGTETPEIHTDQVTED